MSGVIVNAALAVSEILLLKLAWYQLNRLTKRRTGPSLPLHPPNTAPPLTLKTPLDIGTVNCSYSGQAAICQIPLSHGTSTTGCNFYPICNEQQNYITGWRIVPNVTVPPDKFVPQYPNDRDAGGHVLWRI